MVTIVDYKSFEKENGENFFGLVVQGGIEAVKSVQTGKMYFTAKTATVLTTFNEQTCKSLIATTMNGNVKKIDCDSYDYTVKDTGEVILLNHRYEYVTEEMEILQNNVMDKEFVA
ncbi:MAG: hypothetical protein V4548_11505 [Bacteroidota bacterium]